MTRNRSCQFTHEEVLEIAASTECTVDIAARFGVTRQTINAIKSGRTYSYVTGIIPKPRKRHEN